MKKSEEKPSFKVKAESGEKTLASWMETTERQFRAFSDETDDDWRC